MPVSAERRNSIIELASKHVVEQDDETEIAETVLRTVRSTGTKTGSETGGDAESPDAEDLPDVEELVLTDEQRAEVEQMAQTALDNVERHNARTMLSLLNDAHEPDAVESILAGLETLRLNLLRMPEGLGLSIEIVEGYIGKRKTYGGTGESEQVSRIIEMIEKAVKAAYSPESLIILLDLTVRCDKHGQDYKAIVDYFNLVGEPVYRALVDELRNESVRARRMAARTLVVSIGDPCIELLTGNIANERWYVIRNVALILGDMRSDKGIVYLSQALKHADRRVRHEAVNGLGKIGSPQAARSLMTVLSNDDLDTVHAAVRWLGLLASADAVKELVRLMDTLGNSAGQRQLKLSIVDALMQTGSPLAVASLERTQRARKWFFFRKDSVLAEAAARAVETIRERIEKDSE